MVLRRSSELIIIKQFQQCLAGDAKEVFVRYKQITVMIKTLSKPGVQGNYSA